MLTGRLLVRVAGSSHKDRPNGTARRPARGFHAQQRLLNAAAEATWHGDATAAMLLEHPVATRVGRVAESPSLRVAESLFLAESPSRESRLRDPARLGQPWLCVYPEESPSAAERAADGRFGAARGAPKRVRAASRAPVCAVRTRPPCPCPLPGRACPYSAADPPGGRAGRRSEAVGARGGEGGRAIHLCQATGTGERRASQLTRERMCRTVAGRMIRKRGGRKVATAWINFCKKSNGGRADEAKGRRFGESRRDGGWAAERSRMGQSVLMCARVTLSQAISDMNHVLLHVAAQIAL